MSYLFIDDRFAQHPKLTSVGNRAFRAHFTALCYCSGHLTDGELSRAAVKALAIPPRIIQELVDAKLWEESEKGWSIHDYLDWQDSRAEVLARKENAAKGGKARARGAKREGGRFISRTNEGASVALVRPLAAAGPAEPSDSPAPPSPSPSPKRKLALSLREEPEDDEARLSRAFAKLGCSDQELFRELLADDAVGAIVQIVQTLAEKPGQPGASPSSRIRNYLKGATDTLEEERARVRGSTQQNSPESLRHEQNRQFGRLPCSSHCETCEPDDCTGHMG